MFHPLRVGLLALSCLACSIDVEELNGWQRIAQGEKRLSAYLADSERPMELRIISARLLLKMDQLGCLVAVVNEATPKDQRALLERYAQIIIGVLEGKEEPQLKLRAATLAFHLWALAEKMSKEALESSLQRVVEWCLQGLEDPAAPLEKRSLLEILLAAATVRPELALPPIYHHLQTLSNLPALLEFNRLLSRLKSGEVQHRLAATLLSYARRRYPELPPALAEAMLLNRDETLLRFLLELVQDQHLPPATRNLGMDAARDHLKEKALPGLFKLLTTDEPDLSNTFRFQALELIWDFGGPKRLKQALAALPTDASWPEEEGSFKEEVERFCDFRLAQQREKVRAPLLKLLEEPSWVARLYAGICIRRLYPEEADKLLRHLRKDRSPLTGFTEAEDTLGKALMAP